jgi:hypothetical protein
MCALCRPHEIDDSLSLFHVSKSLFTTIFGYALKSKVKFMSKKYCASHYVLQLQINSPPAEQQAKYFTFCFRSNKISFFILQRYRESRDGKDFMNEIT